uniref:Uncharacterized protein n=1 Tax=Panagrolaimus superbus TaxID=310955 RepID=A0A914YE23_9BILA
MSVSDCSDCPGLSHGEKVFSLDELLKMGIVDNEVGDWLKENPMPAEDPLMLLEFLDQNAANGGTQITSTAFQFATMDSVYLARKHMQISHTWAFYYASGIYVDGNFLNYPGQVVPLPRARTVLTKLIHSYSQTKYTVDNEYEFFSY